MFSNIFKQLIQNSGITVYKISKDTGISESLMSQWKSGRQLPKYDSLNILADYFNVSGDFLLGRTDNPDFKPYKKIVPAPVKIPKEQEVKTKLLPLYEQPASAGMGNWLDYDNPVTYTTIVQDDRSVRADFLIKIQGDSMLPKYSSGDVVLIKKTPTIDIERIGVFIINGDSYIKKMGQGELISLNSKYPNILFNDFDDVRCAGEVIGVANLA